MVTGLGLGRNARQLGLRDVANGRSDDAATQASRNSVMAAPSLAPDAPLLFRRGVEALRANDIAAAIGLLIQVSGDHS